MLQGLQFIMLHVPDVERARTFYTETTRLRGRAGDAGLRAVRAPRGGRGHDRDRTGRDTGPATGTELWWFVADADAAHRELVGRGVTTATAPQDEPFGRVFSVQRSGRQRPLHAPAARIVGEFSPNKTDGTGRLPCPGPVVSPPYRPPRCDRMDSRSRSAHVGSAYPCIPHGPHNLSALARPGIGVQPRR